MNEVRSWRECHKVPAVRGRKEGPCSILGCKNAGKFDPNRQCLKCKCGIHHLCAIDHNLVSITNEMHMYCSNECGGNDVTSAASSTFRRPKKTLAGVKRRRPAQRTQQLQHQAQQIPRAQQQQPQTISPVPIITQTAAPDESNSNDIEEIQEPSPVSMRKKLTPQEKQQMIKAVTTATFDDVVV